jgi:hypothetical protein
VRKQKTNPSRNAFYLSMRRTSKIRATILTPGMAWPRIGGISSQLGGTENTFRSVACPDSPAIESDEPRNADLLTHSHHLANHPEAISRERQLQQYRENFGRRLKKQRKEGQILCMLDDEKAYLLEFIDTYNETMQRAPVRNRAERKNLSRRAKIFENLRPLATIETTKFDSSLKIEAHKQPVGPSGNCYLQQTQFLCHF